LLSCRPVSGRRFWEWMKSWNVLASRTKNTEAWFCARLKVALLGVRPERGPGRVPVGARTGQHGDRLLVRRPVTVSRFIQHIAVFPSARLSWAHRTIPRMGSRRHRWQPQFGPPVSPTGRIRASCMALRR
jgi:hypothetical protein